MKKNLQAIFLAIAFQLFSGIIHAQSVFLCPRDWSNSPSSITFLDWNNCPIPVGQYTVRVTWEFLTFPFRQERPESNVSFQQSGFNYTLTFSTGPNFPVSLKTQRRVTIVMEGSNGLTFTMRGENQFGVFSWTDCVVPLTYFDFAVTKPTSACSYLISFKTADVKDMKYFVIERAAGDADWRPIYKQDLENTNAVRSYSFTDNYPLSSQNNYRVKFVDIYGEETYTENRITVAGCFGSTPPIGNCSNISIEETSICDWKAVIYLKNLPYYSKANWTVTQNGSIVSYVIKDDRLIIYKMGAGDITISAKPDVCTNTITKTLKVDIIPSATLTNNGVKGNLNLNNPVRAGQNRLDLTCQSCTGVTWTRVSGSAYINPIGNSCLFDLYSGSVGIRVTGTNACGPFSRTYNFYVSGGNPYGYSASPNPSTGLVMLDGQGDEGIIKEVRILDNLGRLYYKKSFPNGVRRTQLDLSHLKPDFYLIQINNGKESKVQQLILKK
jgi:hypothetical protein